ncbi:MAG: S-adenosylmethionine:tRNA ribosyltransferase-isomerase [Bacteroidales bacterium]|nr:S-adenosylmethionine:tRNA ribosyltransferase-isomerase [Lentimicrobiaceae bacterium]MDD5693698.1 S-adenosylmethionine:tRNA ribosyltransferase-isomerase [Bacteroidales bacterium]
MGFQISDFTYALPADRISQFPLPERDQSKLLLYKDQSISEDIFRNVADHLPARGLLVVNNTRVIHARLLFQKRTGARVEIFCLSPVEPVQEIQSAFDQPSGVTWQCLVGNARRWKQGTLTLSTMRGDTTVTCYAQRCGEATNPCHIRFQWDPGHLTFAQVLEAFGKIPLPPYIQREPIPLDDIRYQTLFARADGSVAAPTAGLHFTDHVLKTLRNKQIERAEVTLHVGAGTFTPIITSRIDDHIMHTETICISVSLIRSLIAGHYSKLIAVGTTTVRTLESLYWYGVKLIQDPGAEIPFSIRQWDPYRIPDSLQQMSMKDSLAAILNLMDRKRMTDLKGQTSLMIVPGYRFRMTDMLITNFHQPQSSLLLLVAAFIGDDWKRAYQYALDHGFRFLSYGDSCLFCKKDLPS